ncbi:MAG: hypothetical protein HY787_08130 [Deltaproteobacteria bacterium]|nr:hypothetical protein [Deltaproteobacteria bacterium]
MREELLAGSIRIEMTWRADVYRPDDKEKHPAVRPVGGEDDSSPPFL